MEEEQGIIKKIRSKVDNYFFNKTYKKFMEGNPKWSKSDIPHLKRMLEEGTLPYEYIVEAAEQIKDKNFIMYCIENSKVGEFHKCKLIKALGDNEYTKKCINNPNLWSSKQITDSSPQFGLLETVSTEDIKQFIQYPGDKISINAKTYLISQIGDIEYTKQCIEDAINLGIPPIKKTRLIIETRDDDFIKQQFMPEEIDTKIDIPKGMTIGAEIETEHVSLSNLYGSQIIGWEHRSDHSLGPGGSELVSPILTGDSKDTEDIYTICNMLKQAGGEATEKCGGHIHIGADYLTTEQSFLNLISIWCNTEKVMYQICNRPGEAHRGLYYAYPVSGTLEKAIEEGKINMQETVSDYKKMQNELRLWKVFWIKYGRCWLSI